MSRALRDGIQEFIASNTKDGVYSKAMKEMSDLYKIVDLLETSATKEKGLSALKVWMRNNPVKARVLGALGVTTLGGTTYGVLK